MHTIHHCIRFGVIINTGITGTVVADSLRLGGASIAMRNNGTQVLQYKDVNGDGYVDLVAKFRTQDLGLSASDTSVALTGTLSNGDIIAGSDTIKIVP